MRTPRWWRDERTRRRVVAALVLVVLVNAPALSSVYRDLRLSVQGVDVAATVVADDVRAVGDEPRYLLGYVLPSDIDADQVRRRAEVDADAHRAAVASGRLTVRVLPDRPAVARAANEVRRRTGLWITLAIDAVLLAAAGAVWARRRRRPATGAPSETTVVALGDLVGTDDPPGRTTVGERGLVIVGELGTTAYGEALLLLPDGTVRVVLEGRAVLAETGERVRVEARPLDWSQ